MSRQARDFSWHLVELAMVVAGLVILAPLAWWRTQEPPVSGGRRVVTMGAARTRAIPPRDRKQVIQTAELRPQLAPIGPLIADQISLDPSIHESPALPAFIAPDLGDLLEPNAVPQMRLSA